MDTVNHFLSHHPFFQGFEPHRLNLIVGCAREVEYKDNQYLFREGEKAGDFFVLREGRARLETHNARDGAVDVQTIEPGDVLGWSWLMSPHTWHFDARALRATKAVALDGEKLRKLFEEDHTLGFRFMKKMLHVMEQRLQATRLRLMDLDRTLTA